MNILAIDQARNGAWSVFDYETKELIGHGTFCFDSTKYTYSKAILHIEELVDILIKAWDITAIFIEDINLRHSPQVFKRLAQLQGVLVNLFEKNEYLYEYVAPSQWQNYCNARGRNSSEVKNQVSTIALDKKESKVLSIQFVKDQFGIETDNDNLADAVCLGWYAINVMTIGKGKRVKKPKKK